MRVLADINFPKALVDWLCDQGHDVIWNGLDTVGMRDVDLLELAEEQGRILFTLDKDFDQLARQRRQPLRWAGVVLFRVHPNFVDDLAPPVRAIVESTIDRRGYISIVTRVGVEMVRLGRS